MIIKPSATANPQYHPDGEGLHLVLRLRSATPGEIDKFTPPVGQMLDAFSNSLTSRPASPEASVEQGPAFAPSEPARERDR